MNLPEHIVMHEGSTVRIRLTQRISLSDLHENYDDAFEEQLKYFNQEGIQRIILENVWLPGTTEADYVFVDGIGRERWILIDGPVLPRASTELVGSMVFLLELPDNAFFKDNSGRVLTGGG